MQRKAFSQQCHYLMVISTPKYALFPKQYALVLCNSQHYISLFSLSGINLSLCLYPFSLISPNEDWL